MNTKRLLVIMVVATLAFLFSISCANTIDYNVYVGVEQAQGASAMMADHYTQYSMDRIAELQQEMADLIAGGGATLEDIEEIQAAIEYEMEFVESWDALDEWFEALKEYMNEFGVEELETPETPEGE